MIEEFPGFLHYIRYIGYRNFINDLIKLIIIANSSSCTTTVLSKLLTSCLTAVKQYWIRYYDTVYERDGINYFWSIKNSKDVLNKFKSKNFQAINCLHRILLHCILRYLIIL